MGKMKEMLLSIVEAYDYNGLTIKQISDTYGMPEDEVIAILSQKRGRTVGRSPLEQVYYCSRILCCSLTRTKAETGQRTTVKFFSARKHTGKMVI